MACWRPGRSPTDAPHAFLGDGSYFFSSSIDTGGSFSLCTAAWRASQLRNKIWVSFLSFFVFNFFLVIYHWFHFWPRSLWLCPAVCGQEKFQQCGTTACTALTEERSRSLPPSSRLLCSTTPQHQTQATGCPNQAISFGSPSWD